MKALGPSLVGLVVLAMVFAAAESLTGEAGQPSARTSTLPEYDVVKVFPDAVKFQYDRRIELLGSGIVKEVRFSRARGKIELSYLNGTDQRVKPDVTVWVLNKDGVVLYKFTDVWVFSSVDPQQRHNVTKGFEFKIPEELVFSRWARVGWDREPAYIIAVGSKYACEKLLYRTTSELDRLNR